MSLFKKSTSLAIKGSAALIHNNLALTSNNKTTIFAVICRNYINMTFIDANDNILNEKQLVIKTTKDGSQVVNTSTTTTQSGNNNNEIIPNLIEIKFVQTNQRIPPILVVCTSKGIIFYDQEATNILYFFSFNQYNKASNDQQQLITYAKGIATIFDNGIVIGTSNGTLLLFEQQQANKIALANQIQEKSFNGNGICDLNFNHETGQLCASDTKWNIAVWSFHSNNATPKLCYILKNDNDFACTSIKFYKNYLLAAYGNGLVTIYNCQTGRKYVDINAHSKWITSMNMSVASNGETLLLTCSEDCYFRLWQLNEINAKFEIRHVQSEFIADSLLTGVQQQAQNNNKIYITSYDCSEIFVFDRK